MNNQEDTLDTNNMFGIEIKRVPINYVGPRETKPKYVEIGPKPDKGSSEAQKRQRSEARLGKKFGPHKKGESK